VLSNKETYEIMTPESIGLNQNKLVLGKHSGRHAFKDKIETMGYKLTSEELNKAFIRFKEVADKKKEVYDRDIDAIISRQSSVGEEKFKLKRFVINSGNSITATAAVLLEKDGEEIEVIDTGDGPIDAAFNAIEKISGTKVKLEDFSLSSVTEGKDALGDAIVKLREKGAIFIGRGLSTDVVEASVKAYINALNKMKDQENIKNLEVV
jgi:2-isopropylmalate synthase